MKAANLFELEVDGNSLFDEIVIFIKVVEGVKNPQPQVSCAPDLLLNPFSNIL